MHRGRVGAASFHPGPVPRDACSRCSISVVAKNVACNNRAVLIRPDAAVEALVDRLAQLAKENPAGLRLRALFLREVGEHERQRRGGQGKRNEKKKGRK